MPTCTFFPDYSASNAYQACLARALGDCRAGTIEDALLGYAPGDVFHQHWEDAIYAGARDVHEAAASYLADLDAFLACGGRLVWTMHNATPHEDCHPAVSAALRAALVARAHIVHVHGLEAAKAARAIGAHEEQLLIVPHPGFHDAYPDDVIERQARRYFGVEPGVTVFAHLGAMRAYKGLDTLRAAFAALHARRPHTRLILAGRSTRTAPGRFVCPSPGVLLVPRHVEDSTVQYVMRAADFMVLPYARITTSSGVMLALTFARPVIVPSLPGLLEVVSPGRDALVYAPGDVTALTDCLDLACRLGQAARTTMQGHARKAADRLTFSDMAAAMRRAIDSAALARAA